MKDRISPDCVVYEMVCNSCGHTQIDNIPWLHCLRTGCTGKYEVVAENPGGI